MEAIILMNGPSNDRPQIKSGIPCIKMIYRALTPHCNVFGCRCHNFRLGAAKFCLYKVQACRAVQIRVRSWCSCAHFSNSIAFAAEVSGGDFEVDKINLATTSLPLVFFCCGTFASCFAAAEAMFRRSPLVCR